MIVHYFISKKKYLVSKNFWRLLFNFQKNLINFQNSCILYIISIQFRLLKKNHFLISKRNLENSDLELKLVRVKVLYT